MQKAPFGAFCIGVISNVLSLGDVVEDVRTIFERINDATIYIPEFQTEIV